MTEEEDRIGDAPMGLRNKVNATTGLFTFAGNLIEVFLPKILDVFVAMTGGTPTDDEKPKRRRTPDNGYEGPRNSPK